VPFTHSATSPRPFQFTRRSALQQGRRQGNGMGVRFEYDRERTSAALVYLATKKIFKLDKYKICKLLFLSDNRHLIQYGRPITGDTYYALDWGPVPSNTLHALNDEDPLAETIARLFKATSGKYPRYSLKSSKSTKAEAKKLIEELLSESDIEVLDEIIAKHGSRSFPELFKITHSMPAYYKAWARRGYAYSSPMNFEEFFEENPEADQTVRQELASHAALVDAIETVSEHTELQPRRS
jgi:uncharacterized phage-associated protein